MGSSIQLFQGYIYITFNFVHEPDTHEGKKINFCGRNGRSKQGKRRKMELTREKNKIKRQNSNRVTYARAEEMRIRGT